MSRFLKNTKGFALAESLIAAALLSVALLGTAGFLIHAIHANQNAGRMAKAASLAQNAIETLKSRPYGSVAGFSDSQSIYTLACRVQTDVPGPDMKTVEAAVTWEWRGVSKEFALKTIIAEK
jgi:Tfp pilus assembly protein PilV